MRIFNFLWGLLCVGIGAWRIDELATGQISGGLWAAVAAIDLVIGVSLIIVAILDAHWERSR